MLQLSQKKRSLHAQAPSVVVQIADSRQNNMVSSEPDSCPNALETIRFMTVS